MHVGDLHGGDADGALCAAVRRIRVQHRLPVLERLAIRGERPLAVAEARHPGAAEQISEAVIGAGQVDARLQAGGLAGGQLLEGRDGLARIAQRLLRVAERRQHVSQLTVATRQVALHAPVLRLRFREAFADGGRLAIGRQGAFRIAQVRRIWISLQVAEAEVGFHHLEFERRVARHVARQAVQIFGRLLDHQHARRRRSGQVADGFLELEQERIRKLVHVIETLFGAQSLTLGDVGLPGDAGKPGQSRRHRQHPGDDGAAVTVEKLARQVGGRGRAGRNGLAGQEPADVGRHAFRRGVARGRVFAQRNFEDRVQVPIQPGRSGRFLRDRVCQRHVAGFLQFVRIAVRQKLVEQHAQRVDVGCDRHRSAGDLLGTGVTQAYRQPAGGFGPGVRSAPENFRDAEIEQPRHAAGGDQHVCRLDVAMHDQVLVGVMDGVADLEEQAQAVFQFVFALAAVIQNRLALDVIHHQVGQAGVGCTAVEQPHDVGVVEGGQRLPLLSETVDDLDAFSAAQDQLDGHLLLELLVRARAQENRAHASRADRPDHHVRTQAAADHL